MFLHHLNLKKKMSSNLRKPGLCPNQAVYSFKVLKRRLDEVNGGCGISQAFTGQPQNISLLPLVASQKSVHLHLNSLQSQEAHSQVVLSVFSFKIDARMQ